MTYYDLTIDKYLQLREVLSDAERDDLEIQAEMIAVMNECGVDDILDLPLDEYKKKVRDIDFLLEPPAPSPKCPKTITIDGEVFEATREVKKFTAGQYIDFQNLIQSEDIYTVLPNILACFFTPKGKAYGKDYDIMEVADKIRNNVSVGLAMDVSFFFLKQSRRLINRTLDSLVLMTKMEMRKTKNKEMKEKMKEAIVKLEEMKASLSGGIGSIRPI